MKKIILFLLTLFCCIEGYSQNINKIEYFIDADPGYAAGTNVPITAATTVTTNFNVSLTSVVDGFHTLSIRGRDVNNAWSMVGIRPFYKETLSSSSTPPNVTAIEYFIDADPGYGAGTAVTVTAGSPLITTFTASLASVSDGFHTLSIRAKDVNNRWSVVGIRPFYKESLSSSSIVPNIIAMEYFIDADPGYGVGTAVTVTAGSPVTTTFTASLASVSNGFHTLSIRAKDVNNRWSVVGVRPFYKETLSSGSVVPNITQMEYFIDADPGYGLATALTVTAGSPITQNVNISLGSLTNGVHKLSIRAKDVNNKWSVVGIKDFTVQDNIVVAGTTPASWCKNTAFSIPFTASGTYTSGNVFTAQLSDASGSFSSPTTLGTLTSTSSGTIMATIPNTIALGTGYKIRIISSLPAITNSPQKMIDVSAICQCLLNISLMTGNWGTASLWSCGHVPLATEPVQIAPTHTVNLNVNGTAKSLDLRGVLQKQTGFTLQVQGN
jgi:hypothetical protein